MKIRNKIESISTIKRLGLNQFPEKIINLTECGSGEGYTEALKFMKKYPVKYYTLRDKSKNGGKAFHIVKSEEMEECVKVYDKKFTILVSSYNYKDNQKVVGEILVKGENIHLLVSFNGEYSIRDVYKNPDLCLNTTIFDDKTLNGVPHFNEIYKFIIDNKLENIIVEFGYFDKKVGLKNTNFIIYELRTDY